MEPSSGLAAPNQGDTGAATPTARRASPFWPAIVGGWAVVSIILIAATLRDIIAFQVLDPDDWMRLLEVRDWLAGQSWWDVAQHRLNGGDFPMHWSRLVDLPLAAVIGPLDPLLGPALAYRIAMILVPLLTLLAIMAGAAMVARRLGGTGLGVLAIPLVALAIPIVLQAHPMRIDHHGWQIALAAWAMLGLLSRPSARNGALTGLALATLVTISLEGLPIAVVIATVAALGWLWRPGKRKAFTRALAGSLFGVALVLHLATRGPNALAPACDAISPAYLGALGIAAAGLALATLAGRARLPVRLASLVIPAGLAAIAFALTAPVCLKGPFATLDPLVYRYWYLNVLEGMPMWRQSAVWASIQVALPLIGLVGAWFGWRGATGDERRRWVVMLAVQIAAFALAILVARAGGTANVMAIPGAAVVLGALLRRARAIQRPVPRIVATAGALLCASPGLLVSLVVPLVTPQAADNTVATTPGHGLSVRDFTQVRAMAALPPSIVFAPIDVTPGLLVSTPHRAIGAGYHRGGAAIHKILAAFMADPARAQRIVAATHARYLIALAGTNEMNMYRKAAPNGLWARLARGEHIAWLVPVHLPGSSLLVWQVSPSAASPPPRPTAHPSAS